MIFTQLKEVLSEGIFPVYSPVGKETSLPVRILRGGEEFTEGNEPTLITGVHNIAFSILASKTDSKVNRMMTVA